MPHWQRQICMTGSAILALIGVGGIGASLKSGSQPAFILGVLALVVAAYGFRMGIFRG